MPLLRSPDGDRPRKRCAARRLPARRLVAPRHPRDGRRYAKLVALNAGLLVLVLALLATPRVAVAGPSDRQALVSTVNDARASHGLRPLRLARGLQRSSRRHARWMLDNQYFGHLSVIRAPRRFRLRGEVLARTARRHPSRERIVRQWLASPFHRAVLLNRRFRFIGVGLARGRLGSRPVTLVAGHFGAG